jgi:lysophospholipase L1-like esterase
MLGTNDLKHKFGLSAADIAAGAVTLVDIILRSSSGPNNVSPKVLLICPPPTARLTLFADMFGGVGEKSRALATHYQREASLRECAFLDAGQIIASSQRDGIHFEADAHQALGQAVARNVQELLGA